MGLWGDFKAWARPLSAERDSLQAPSRLIGLPLDGGLVWNVTSTTALGLSAVWRCLDILSNGVCRMERHEKRGTLDLPWSRLVRQPQSNRTWREWASLVVSTLALYDICYLLKTEAEDAEGVPLSLIVLPPDYVQPWWQPSDPFHVLPPTMYSLGGNKPTDADRLVVLRRSPQPGVDESIGGIIRLARTSFAAHIAAENYASRYWQGGGSPNIVLESAQKIPEAIADQYEDRWRERRMKGPDYAPLMSGGITVRELGADPTAAAAVEARREQVADVGRYFGIPSNILNAPAGDSETYSTTEAQGLHLVTYTLGNYRDAITDAISSQLPGGRYLHLDDYALTRGTNLAQAQAYQLATGGKAWMTPEDVRDRLGLPPVEDPEALNPTPAPAPVGAPQA